MIDIKKYNLLILREMLILRNKYVGFKQNWLYKDLK
jgi:hypothetical protein